jgi:hypothetical protein
VIWNNSALAKGCGTAAVRFTWRVFRAAAFFVTYPVYNRLYKNPVLLACGGALVNSQIEDFDDEKREKIVDWILAGRDFYKDDIEYAGDWVCISVYLPQ